MEFEHKGQKYSTKKLDARKQFHLAMKLAPLVSSLAQAFKPGQKVDDIILSALPVFANGLSQMSEKDVDYVLETCLSVVQRQDTGGWQQIMASSGVMVYSDLQWTDLTVIVWNVIQDNLGNFTDALPSGALQTASQ